MENTNTLKLNFFETQIVKNTSLDEIAANWSVNEFLEYDEQVCILHDDFIKLSFRERRKKMYIEAYNAGKLTQKILEAIGSKYFNKLTDDLINFFDNHPIQYTYITVKGRPFGLSKEKSDTIFCYSIECIYEYTTFSKIIEALIKIEKGEEISYTDDIPIELLKEIFQEKCRRYNCHVTPKELAKYISYPKLISPFLKAICEEEEEKKETIYDEEEEKKETIYDEDGEIAMNTKEKIESQLVEEIVDMLQNGKSPEDIVYDFVKDPILTSLFDVLSLLGTALTNYDLPIEVADKLTKFLENDYEWRQDYNYVFGESCKFSKFFHLRRDEQCFLDFILQIFNQYYQKCKYSLLKFKESSFNCKYSVLEHLISKNLKENEDDKPQIEDMNDYDSIEDFDKAVEEYYDDIEKQSEDDYEYYRENLIECAKNIMNSDNNNASLIITANIILFMYNEIMDKEEITAHEVMNHMYGIVD